MNNQNEQKGSKGLIVVLWIVAFFAIVYGLNSLGSTSSLTKEDCYKLNTSQQTNRCLSDVASQNSKPLPPPETIANPPFISVTNSRLDVNYGSQRAYFTINNSSQYKDVAVTLRTTIFEGKAASCNAGNSVYSNDDTYSGFTPGESRAIDKYLSAGLDYDKSYSICVTPIKASYPKTN